MYSVSLIINCESILWKTLRRPRSLNLPFFPLTNKTQETKSSFCTLEGPAGSCLVSHVPNNHSLPGPASLRASFMAQLVKNPLANAGVAREVGLIPGPGRPPRRGNGNPLPYSCLGNPMDRGAWQATIHGVAT